MGALLKRSNTATIMSPPRYAVINFIMCYVQNARFKVSTVTKNKRPENSHSFESLTHCKLVSNKPNAVLNKRPQRPKRQRT